MKFRPIAPVAVIAAAALLAVMPLLVNGCSCGHDFNFHLVNWMEAHRQMAHGALLSKWAYTAAWNAGEPRFIFYPPLSWRIGGLLGFLLPFTAAPIAYTWLCLFVSGLTCLRMIRLLPAVREAAAGNAIAISVSVLYLANPYLLFTAYERTAYAELLASACMPLLLAALLRTRIRIAELAVAIGLLWLSNLPAAVIGCYAVLITGVIRLAVDRGPEWRNTLRLACGTALGLGLSAFYLIPAIAQKGFVQTAMAKIGGMQITDNFLFAHTDDPLHDAVLWQASRIALCFLVLSLGTAVYLHRKQATKATATHLGLLSLAVLLLLLPISAPVWAVAPQLAFLQFPWRFLSLQQAVVAALLAMTLATISIGKDRRVFIFAAFALVIAFTTGASRYYRQGCDEEDNPQAQIANFNAHGGVFPFDEYTLAGADNDLLGHNNPGWWLSGTADGAAPASVSTPQLPDSLHISIAGRTAQAAYLIVNRRAYPAWQIAVNGNAITPIHRADGLMAVHVPAGEFRLSVEPSMFYGYDLAGFGTALAALGITVAASLRQRRSLRTASSGTTVYS